MIYAKNRRGLAALLVSALFLFSCASSKMAGLMPNVHNMYMARFYFGEPSSSDALPDGRVVYHWVLDRDVKLPERTEVREVYMGHDSDGFRRYRQEEFYVPASVEHLDCRLSITAGSQGEVLSSSWEGATCDQLPIAGR